MSPSTYGADSAFRVTAPLSLSFLLVVLGPLVAQAFGAGYGEFAPMIQSQPAPQLTCSGDRATFTVAAAANPPPTYQWRRNGINIVHAGAGASFVVSAASSNDAGMYDCVLSNALGSVTSSAASLTLASAPSISISPAVPVVCSGASVTFSAAISGTMPRTLQWYRAGVATPIAGASAASLTINPVLPGAAGGYSCVIQNACGASASNISTLTVATTAPTMSMQPAGRSACLGASTSFAVTAANAPSGYQWRKNGAAIASATAASYTVANLTPASAGVFDCVVTNCFGSVTSDAAALVVTSDTTPSIRVQPFNQVTSLGASVTFNTDVTGSPSPSFQWRKNRVNLPGEAANSLTINPVTASSVAFYDCVVTNACGSATTIPAGLSIPGSIADAQTYPSGSPVTLGGVRIANTIDLINDPTLASCTLEDATGAVTVFGGNAAIQSILSALEGGNVLTSITGTTQLFNGLFELVSVTAVTPANRREPVSVTAITSADFADGAPLAPSLESRIVMVNGCRFTSSGRFTALNAYSASGVPIWMSTPAVAASLNAYSGGIPTGVLVALKGVFIQNDVTPPLDGDYELRLTEILPTCTADFNGSGQTTVQDIFDFLLAYFAADPRADINRLNGVTVQDIFEYLIAYFTGCS